ncbi:MAG: UDP-N-acetylglucosamine--N-acetylmuramyl-(pentapeptide) pyrophosphoryl-undecaprenol N-acetylglucosamine transferase [Candidatus Omnitrophota bacterium]|nr:UDP-N-acetylglucosamine--N-acetylmuramyl-(pentapeptide) pyrophosphoryl-undecaprenol N-acetylglucosamine transferase [Candidatus Omnitrophota bacterium]
MKVLIVSGSSGGHIFPAIALLEELNKRNNRGSCLLVIPRKKYSFGLGLQPSEVRYITFVRSTTKSVSLLAGSLWSLLKSFLESFFIIIEFKPQAVVGFGTITSVPVVFWAWLLRIKTIIHEQNVIPGRANMILARIVDVIAVSFPETAAYINDCRQRVELVGNPLRKNMRLIAKDKAFAFFGLNQGKFTILVVGGSQGSKRINLAILEALTGLDGASRIQVLHLGTGDDYAVLEKGYRSLGVDFRLFPFLKEMEYAYSASDLVICRAGATTIAELLYFHKPAIIIPYPYAYNHQMANAAIMESRGLARIIEDPKLDEGLLQICIQDMMNRPLDMSQLIAPQFDARQRLADTLLSL